MVTNDAQVLQPAAKNTTNHLWLQELYINPTLNMYTQVNGCAYRVMPLRIRELGILQLKTPS